MFNTIFPKFWLKFGDADVNLYFAIWSENSPNDAAHRVETFPHLEFKNPKIFRLRRCFGIDFFLEDSLSSLSPAGVSGAQEGAGTPFPGDQPVTKHTTKKEKTLGKKVFHNTNASGASNIPGKKSFLISRFPLNQNFGIFFAGYEMQETCDGPSKFVCYLAPTSPQFMDIYLSSFWTFLWPNWHKSGPNFCTFGAKKITKRFFPTFRPASYVSCKMTHCKIPYQNTKESFLDNFCRRRATPHFGPQPSQLSIFFGAFAL